MHLLLSNSKLVGSELRQTSKDRSSSAKTLRPSASESITYVCVIGLLIVDLEVSSTSYMKGSNKGYLPS